MTLKPHVAYLYPALLLYSTVLFATYISRVLLVVGLFSEKTCNSPDNADCDDDDKDSVSQRVALISTWIGLATGIPQILVSPYMGRLANRVGRRAPPVVVLLGTMLANMVIVVVTYAGFSPNWIILAGFFEGSTGSYSSFLIGTSSMTADLNMLLEVQKQRQKSKESPSSATPKAELSSNTENTQRFAYLEAMLALGVVLGPLCGAFVSEALSVEENVKNFSYFFLGAAVLLGVDALYMIFVVPETLFITRALSLRSRGDSIASSSSVAAIRYDPFLLDDLEVLQSQDQLQAEEHYDAPGNSTFPDRSDKSMPAGENLLTLRCSDELSRGQLALEGSSGSSILTTLRLAFVDRPYGPRLAVEEDVDEDKIIAADERPRLEDGDAGSISSSNQCPDAATRDIGGNIRSKAAQTVKLAYVSIAFMMLFGSGNSLSVILTLYTQREWNWGPFMINIFIAALGGAGAFCLLFSRTLYPYAMKFFSLCCSAGKDKAPTELQDMTFMITAAAASCTFNVLFAVLNSPVAGFVMLPLLSFQLGAIPSYRNLYSNAYGANEQASIFAAFSMLESIPNLLAPVLVNEIYAFTVKVYPQTVFLVIGFVAFISGLLLRASIRGVPTAPVDENIIKKAETRDRTTKNTSSTYNNMAGVSVSENVIASSREPLLDTS